MSRIARAALAVAVAAHVFAPATTGAEDDPPDGPIFDQHVGVAVRELGVAANRCPGDATIPCQKTRLMARAGFAPGYIGRIPDGPALGLQLYLVATAADIGSGIDGGPRMFVRLPVSSDLAIDTRFAVMVALARDTGHPPALVTFGAGLVRHHQATVQLDFEMMQTADGVGPGYGIALVAGLDHPPAWMWIAEGALAIVGLGWAAAR